MRTLNSNNTSINVRANHAARLFYNIKFKRDIDKDIKILLAPDGGFRLEMYKAGVNFSQMMKYLNALDSTSIKADDSEETKGEKNKLYLETIKQIMADGVDFDALIDMESGGEDEENNKKRLPSYELMKIIWAMAKTEAAANGTLENFTEDYDEWLIKNGDFDVNDCAEDFMEEVNQGFFRKNNKGNPYNRKSNK